MTVINFDVEQGVNQPTIIVQAFRNNFATILNLSQQLFTNSLKFPCRFADLVSRSKILDPISNPLTNCIFRHPLTSYKSYLKSNIGHFGPTSPKSCNYVVLDLNQVTLTKHNPLKHLSNYKYLRKVTYQYTEPPNPQLLIKKSLPMTPKH